MDREHELAIWRSVYETCGAPTFVSLVEEALGSYKLAPGLDWPTRLHVSEVGLPCVQALRGELSIRGLDTSTSDNYIEIRSRLKDHLCQQLQLHLGGNHRTLKEWKAQYGASTVESWVTK
jgi:hypothetical protein